MVTLTDLKHGLFTRYKDIKSVYCPALEAEVHFTLKGWKHVLGQERNQRKRKGKEVIDRLNILLEVPQLIKRINVINESRIQKGKEYVGFIIKYEKENIKVVVEKDKMSKYIFFSVFIIQKK